MALTNKGGDTGDWCQVTAEYEVVECKCRVAPRQTVKITQAFPPCPGCKETVTWERIGGTEQPKHQYPFS